ncbi:hypothetical protein C900_01663 [Fulvivirga imtechensis AK7]|uniref:Class IIb bacteriocin, lactobin A/cerein 7B family n=1 Tax=Fulvivirga imtechensis AK7 TaxID=1237149 RepID=L8JTR6_9BACT|nr:hypothetical protein [Fulvivirga imtechensis]ELR72381.1 hypothetical protein C900_01663 [Fulvivirga imtechensis AK7]
MKNLELSAFQELTAKESAEIKGGDFGLTLAVVGLGIYLFDNREKFVAGIKDGLQID